MKTLLLISLLLSPFSMLAQSPAPDSRSAQKGQREENLSETNSVQLILDNTRTKVGRDFYDLFYKCWTAMPIQPEKTPADTTQPREAGLMVIMIEEIPSPGTASQLLISIRDQPVWQQLVQARYELLEANASVAVETVRQYLASYQEMLQLLGSQEQNGAGVY